MINDDWSQSFSETVHGKRQDRCGGQEVTVRLPEVPPRVDFFKAGSCHLDGSIHSLEGLTR